tara:strand:- start:104 stop:673 length:570 start_codon:yes stop_codon:yes gene_type:complete
MFYNVDLFRRQHQYLCRWQSVGTCFIYPVLFYKKHASLFEIHACGKKSGNTKYLDATGIILKEEKVFQASHFCLTIMIHMSMFREDANIKSLPNFSKIFCVDITTMVRFDFFEFDAAKAMFDLLKDEECKTLLPLLEQIYNDWRMLDMSAQKRAANKINRKAKDFIYRPSNSLFYRRHVSQTTLENLLS